MSRPPRFGIFGRRKASARPMPRLSAAKRTLLLDDLPILLDEESVVELLGKAPLPPAMTYCKSPRPLYPKADVVALLSGAKLEDVASAHNRFGPDAEPAVSLLRETLPISWSGPGCAQTWRRYSDTIFDLPDAPGPSQEPDAETDPPITIRSIARLLKADRALTWQEARDHPETKPQRVRLTPGEVKRQARLARIAQAEAAAATALGTP